MSGTIPEKAKQFYGNELSHFSPKCLISLGGSSPARTRQVPRRHSEPPAWPGGLAHARTHAAQKEDTNEIRTACHAKPTRRQAVTVNLEVSTLVPKKPFLALKTCQPA